MPSLPLGEIVRFGHREVLHGLLLAVISYAIERQSLVGIVKRVRCQRDVLQVIRGLATRLS